MTNGGHGVPKEEMCRTHVTSCHAEIHQELGHIKRGNWGTVFGHMKWGQFLPNEMSERHEELADEINKRAEATGTGNGHNRDTVHKPGRYGSIYITPEFVFGIPSEALKLYNRNIFKVEKDCDCFTRDSR